MTNEEARKILNSSFVWQKMVDEECEALELAIKALELEPCEDCINRQAVDTLVDELARAISDERNCLSRGRSTATIMQDILDLPSVTPQQKTGRWAILKDEYGDIVDAVCSCCDEHGNHEWAFCPHCGARMEVEDK